MKSITQRLKQPKTWLACALALALIIPAGGGAAFAENNAPLEEQQTIPLEQTEAAEEAEAPESEEAETLEGETELPVVEEELVSEEEVVESEDAVVEEATEVVEGEEVVSGAENVIEEAVEAEDTEPESGTSTDEQISTLGEEGENLDPTEDLAVGLATTVEEEIKPMTELDPGLIKNLEWNLYKMSNNTEPARDQGSDPANYADGFSHHQEAYAVMTFDINAPAPEGFQSGDTLAIPFFEDATFMAIDNTAAEKLYASGGGVELGTWRIQNRNIIITFNSGAVGQGSLSNCRIETGKSLRPINSKIIDRVVTYTVGGKSHTYKINALVKTPQADSLTKTIGSTTNMTAVWALGTSRDMLNDLTTSSGQSIRNITSVIVEDEIPVSEGITGLELSAVRVPVPYIMSESNPVCASANGTWVLSYYITDKFEGVTPEPSDTYETFKAKVKAFQYGIFKTSDGSFKFIINYGNPQADDYPLKYSDLWSDLKTDVLAVDKGLTIGEADIIAASLADNNVINGNVVSFIVDIRATYQQALVDTQKTNTADAIRVLDGNSEIISKTATGVLRTGDAVATPSAMQARIGKFDKASGAPLENVVFAIQSTTDGGSTWNPSGYSNITTAADGTATTATLSPGSYRFKEVSGLDGYDTTNGVS